MPKMTADRRSSRRAYLAGASMVALGVALAAPQQAKAQTINSAVGPQTITGNNTLFTITNSGTISGVTAIINNGGLGTLSNNGRVLGSAIGIYDTISASIDQLTNAAGATIAGSSNVGVSIAAGALVNFFTNNGNISGLIGIGNAGIIITAISNTGTIAGGNTGLANSGTLNALTNSGTISGSLNALINSGTIGGGSVPGAQFGNTGIIAGNIVNAGNLSITGGVNATVGTLTGYAQGTEGTITNTTGNIVVSGNQLLNDAVNVGPTHTLTNAGGNVSLISIVSITGNYNQSSGFLNEGAGAELVVSGAASITGGSIVVASVLPSTGNYLSGSIIGTLVKGGSGSTYTGVTGAFNTPQGLAEQTTVTANNLIGFIVNDYVGGVLASISNTGSIGGVPTAVYVATTGALGAVTNSGTLSASLYGLGNNGTIGSIGNSGAIIATYGISNGIGTIGTIVNSGTITATHTAISNGTNNTVGSIGTIVNSGTIIGTSNGIGNSNQIAVISNAASGVISVGGTGIVNDGFVGTLTNNGAISGVPAIGIYGGTFGTIINNGTIADANYYGIYNLSGSIGILINNGTMSGYVPVENFGSIGAIVNSGTISSLIADLNGGKIGTINNSGFISSVFNNVTAGTVLSTIGTLTNSGSIGAINNHNASKITIVNNTQTGVIGGGSTGLSNIGSSIGTLSNSGKIIGSSNAIYNTGTIATLSNTGTVAGNIYNTSDLSIAGGAGTLFGTLTGYAANTQSTITNTTGNVVLSGNQVLNDTVSIGSTHTLTNAGGNIQLISIVSIDGNYAQTTGTLTEGAGAELVTGGAASITGGTIRGAGTLVATGNYLPGASAGTLVQGGASSNYVGVTVTGGGITGLDETGTVNGNNLVSFVTNDYVGGNQAGIANTGSFTGVSTPVYVAGTLGSLTNSGTLSGGVYGVGNNGTTGSIGNSGLIAGGQDGIFNSIGTIGSIGNSGTITGTNAAIASGYNGAGSIGVIANSGSISSASIGINNAGAVGAISNAASGVISAANSAISNGGSIGALSNSGKISGGSIALGNYGGSFGAVINSGSIGGSVYGLYNQSGSIGSINNSGTIAGGNIGLLNQGSIGTIINNGLIQDVPAPAHIGLSNAGSIANLANNGTIFGATGLGNSGSVAVFSNTGTITGVTNAIKNSGSGNLGTVSNSGVIAGNILNTSANDLTFAGGSGSTYGTLTGYTAGSQGTITGTTANVVFAAGQIFLNDAMNLGSHSFVNSGATIQINNAIAVTGNFVQTSGTLLIGATSATSYGDIVVTGNATITGGTVSVAAVGGFTLAANQTYTIVQAHGSLSVSGLTASVTNYVPVIQTIAAGGYNDLILTLNTIGSTTTGTTGTVTGTTGTVTGTTGAVTGTTASSPNATVYTALGNATGGVATGIGPALDRIAAGASGNGGTGSNSALYQQFYNSILVPLNALPTSAAKHTAITQLSPGQLTPQAAPIAVTPALDAITEHQNTLPGATDGLGALSRGAGAGSDGQQGALWGQLLAGNATRDQGNGAAGYGATTYGVLAGADFLVNPELLAGVAIDWITSRVTGNDALVGSNTRLSSYQFEGYGSWRPDRFDGRLTVDGQLGFGENSYKQYRAISYLNLGANAHFDGQQYVASILTGYRLDIQGPVQVAPYLRLRETHLVNGGYSETGAGLADLAVNGVTTDSFTHELGVKAGMEFDTQFGKMFPAVKLGWIHDYTNGPIALTGNLLGGTVFTSATSQPGADGAALGLTLDLKRTDSFSLSIEYDGEYHKDFTSNTGLVNGTWKF